MKKFFLPILMFCLVSLNTLADEVKSTILSNLSDSISEHGLSLIPGEGYTEFEFKLEEESEPSFFFKSDIINSKQFLFS